MLTLISASILGAITWTLTEYWLHRLLGHRPGKNLFTKEHLKHHFKSNYFAPAIYKLGLAIVVITTLYLFGNLFLSSSNALAYAIGFTIMYLVYEWVHRRLHTNEPVLQNAYGHMLRRHHSYHHFGNKEINHGVTSPFWDMVFGTYFKAEEIIVPRKLAFHWMRRENLGGIYRLK